MEWDTEVVGGQPSWPSAESCCLFVCSVLGGGGNQGEAVSVELVETTMILIHMEILFSLTVKVTQN